MARACQPEPIGSDKAAGKLLKVVSGVKDVARGSRAGACHLSAAPGAIIWRGMQKTYWPACYALPLMMVRLTAASWETILRRGVMMAEGTCTAAEYQRMVAEKTTAMQLSLVALATGRDGAAVLAPFVTRARANAKRLRRTR